MPCGSDFCAEPCFECDCQAGCEYIAKYGQKVTMCLVLCEHGDPANISSCRSKCHDDANTTRDTCKSNCPDDALIPNLAPMSFVWSLALNSGFNIPIHFENGNNQTYVDCEDVCTTAYGHSLDSCNDSYEDCTATCTGADPTPCLEACDTARLGCDNGAFTTASGCYTTCLSSGQDNVLKDLEQINELTTKCQNAPGSSGQPGDDAPLNTQASEKDTCARCLRLAAREHYLNTYPALIAAQTAAGACETTFGGCVVGAEDPTDIACATAEWKCLIDVWVNFLTGLIAPTQLYAEKRAQCLTRWLRYDSRITDKPSDGDPKLKFPVCHAEMLAAFPITKPQPDRTQRGGWMRADLEGNAYRMQCEINLYKCVKLCAYEENPADFLGGVTCIGECNYVANRCTEDINRDRIDDRTRTARLYLPRIPAKPPEGTAEPSNQPFHAYHPHDYGGAWCIAQAHGLYDYCQQALQLNIESCLVTCCFDPDCEADCNKLEWNDSSGTPCLDQFKQCLDQCDPTTDGAANTCRPACFKALEACIIIDPSTSMTACQDEIQYWDSRVKGNPKTGCCDLYPDCPDFSDDFWDPQDGLACLTGASWDFMALGPAFPEFPCD